MKAQHTPGPWHVSGLAVYAEPEEKSFGGPARQYQRIVAKAYENELMDENAPDYRERVNGIQGNNIRFAGYGEAQANARLIAAAPDLLAALERFAEYFHDYDMDGELPGFIETMNQARAAIAKAKGQV